MLKIYVLIKIEFSFLKLINEMFYQDLNLQIGIDVCLSFVLIQKKQKIKDNPNGSACFPSPGDLFSNVVFLCWLHLLLNYAAAGLWKDIFRGT